MKQTAVEDLETQIEKLRFQGVTEWQYGYQKALNEVLFLLKKAKEMEKEQIIDAYVKGYLEDVPKPSSMQYYEPLAEQYYNETFKQQEQ
jgi:hypothetical protein